MTRTGELVLGSAVTVVGLALLIVVLPHEIRVVASEAGEVSPAFFPRIVCGLSIFIGAAHILVAAMAPADNDLLETAGTSRQAALRAIATFAIGGAYIFLLPGIGFIAATAGALVGLTVLFGNRPVWQAFAVGVPVSIVLFYVFGELLKTPLPRAGWLE